MQVWRLLDSQGCALGIPYSKDYSGLGRSKGDPFFGEIPCVAFFGIL